MSTLTETGIKFINKTDDIVLNQAQHQFQVFRADPKAKLPFKATIGSAGHDLYTVDAGTLYPGETKIFSLGLIIRPPVGYHTKIWGRSGWGSKYGVGIPHAMGLVDRDFCGPDDVMKVVLHRACMNGHSKDYLKPLTIEVGDRIAQMTIEPTIYFEMKELDTPPSTISRGGWGSTGIK
jgi:dUTP pyrophosphatase